MECEFSITYQDHVGDFNYYASANWSCEQSKVLYKDEQKVPYEYLRTTGKPKRQSSVWWQKVFSLLKTKLQRVL